MEARRPPNPRSDAAKMAAFPADAARGGLRRMPETARL